MFGRLRTWRRRRLLARLAIPDHLWSAAVDALPFLDRYSDSDLRRLRDLVSLFLHEKGIVGAHDFEVTPEMRVLIGVQACLPVLNLDLDYYAGWENVVVYPDEFVPRHRYEDEAGVVHETDAALAGEAMDRGPVLLSWPDVEASADWDASGMNLVIHEFAHKLDMINGEADGLPPLGPGMSVSRWQAAFSAAFADFRRRVDNGEDTLIDPYAAEHPAEFFAVVSEVFFAEPEVLRAEYPEVYAELCRFYRQDPARMAGLD